MLLYNLFRIFQGGGKQKLNFCEMIMGKKVINKVIAPRIIEDLKLIDILDRNLEDDELYEEIHFDSCDMYDQIAEHVEFLQCIFKNVNITNSKLRHIDLTDVIFENCDLSNVDFSNGIIHRVEFKNCKLVGANFADSTLQNVKIEECNCDYANFAFAALKNVEIKNSTLNSGSIESCKVSGVEFNGVTMRRFDISKAGVKGIDFTSCDIEGLIGEVRDLYGIIVTPMQALSLSKIMGIVIK